MCLFKIQSCEDLNKIQISHIPWTKVELRAIVKELLKVTEDLHKFAEEFIIVIEAHQPGFSDL